MIEVMGATTLAPGEKGGVRIFPLAPDQWRHLDVGTAVAMKESPAFVTGEGIVTAVGEMSRHVPGRDVAEARPADR